jgi:excinuclease ABC subunit A
MSIPTTRSRSLVIKGARENNLKNIDVEIPREQLVVITGLSGSGKSSLAFETIYAEGQRRFLESLSAYARRRVEQVKKPDVDFVYGLSPVVSIEQKTVGRNPRSTIGTMTDIYDYMRILFATAGVAHCPYCYAEVPIKTPHQIAEHLLALPAGTAVEICAPMFKIYGEDYPYLFAEIRTRGYRRLYIDGAPYEISDELELDEGRMYTLEAVIDKFLVKPVPPRGGQRDIRNDIEQQVVTAVEHALRMGEGFLRFRVVGPHPPTHSPIAMGEGERLTPFSPIAMGEGERLTPFSPIAMGKGERLTPFSPIAMGKGERLTSQVYSFCYAAF